MRALSLKPWWAELILLGKKTSEFRSRRTHIRGRVFIYSTLGGVISQEDEAWIKEEYGVDLERTNVNRDCGDTRAPGCDRDRHTAERGLERERGLRWICRGSQTGAVDRKDRALRDG